nr:CD276 antigen homolog [Misgurnus anguillicaudatus]
MQAQFDGVVEGVTGGFVILPCPTNSTDELKTEDITVHWRHNDVKIVCDIINGEYSGSDQDPKYKSRAETFPNEYKKGNFSLKLTNLTRADGGDYQCFIIEPTSKLVAIQLIVNESTAHNEKQSTAHSEEQPTAGNEKKEKETRTKCILVVVFCAVMLCVLICVALFLRKKCAKTTKSGTSVTGGLSCGDSKSEPATINHQDYSVLQTNT